MIVDEPKHANSRTAKRPTEGSRANSGTARADRIATARRGRGRPPGAKNKSKSLVPTELAEQLLLKMEGVVPPEHMKYLKGVIKEGKSVSTKQELDTLILLLNRNLWPALVAENKANHVPAGDDPAATEDVEEDKGPVFRKDVTERLKVLTSLLNLRHQIDKNEEGDDEDGQPLLKVFASRGIANRLGILIGEVPAPKALPSGEERGADDAQSNTESG